ncbi:alpha/beta hydrolase [Mycolicibacterium gadium]|uniref:Alpha/beta hydrolase n=2 Tax=Mycolicibacterium gadium TaxID=1794 RepID=A0ABT6H0N8_MYCGU|nr:alpha/beta hydrolase [Mycolicibacterium gadium]
MQSWTAFADALTARTIVTFDAPGVGLSETPPGPLSMPMFSDIAMRVLNKFGFSKADVIGFSFGGAVAQQLAVCHPDLVNRLVLLSTSCGLGSVPGRTRDVIRKSLTFGHRPLPVTDPLGVFWQVAAISTWSSIPVLGHIEAPTLVLCGERDRTVPPANSKLLAGRIPNARLVTVPAGHDLQEPGPAAIVAKEVERFLDAAVPC